MTVGVRVILHERDRGQVCQRLDADWGGFTFRGFLLNAVEPWQEVFGAPVTLEATDGPGLAQVSSSEHEALQRMLRDEDRVLLPRSGPQSPPVGLAKLPARNRAKVVRAVEQGGEAWVGHTFTGTVLNSVRP